MRYLMMALSVLLFTANPVQAEVNFGVSIGINVPAYPGLVRVPGYPVYYDPQASANYFFYDGLYWVYQDDNWYASSWYNGPWELTSPDQVPLFVLRIPVGFYRQPPPYFHGWAADAPPHWGEHWGHEWEGHRNGWDQWDRRAAPRPAPLPKYQREYSNERYPHEPEQQHAIQSEHYNYKPREAVTQQHFQPRASTGNPPNATPMQSPMQAPAQPHPVKQAAPQDQPSRAHQNQDRPQQSAPRGVQQPVQPPPSRPAQPQQPMNRTQGGPQDNAHENRGNQPDKGRDNRDEDHGRDHK